MLSFPALATAAILGLIPSQQLIAVQPYDGCGRIFTCEIDNGGDGVDVGGGGWEPTPAEPSRPTPETGPDNPPEPAPSAPSCTVDDFRDTACVVVVLPDYPDTIYNTDLIRFVPHAPSADIANEGMTLVTSPASVSVAADAHSLTGTLLGYPVTVAFTPVRVSIDFGDGTYASSPDASAVFDHTYPARGTYATTLIAEYSATVTFSDNTARPVIGTVTSRSPGPDIRVLAARTALTHDTCITMPRAPGC